MLLLQEENSDRQIMIVGTQAWKNHLSLGEMWHGQLGTCHFQKSIILSESKGTPVRPASVGRGHIFEDRADLVYLSATMYNGLQPGRRAPSTATGMPTDKHRMIC